MNGSKVNISNSEFKRFKAGSGDQFVRYLSKSDYEYLNDKEKFKLMFH